MYSDVKRYKLIKDREEFSIFVYLFCPVFGAVFKCSNKREKKCNDEMKGERNKKSLKFLFTMNYTKFSYLFRKKLIIYLKIKTYHTLIRFLS